MDRKKDQVASSSRVEAFGMKGLIEQNLF
jgi:hypothetical protein